jgi:hypothetical protein
MMQQSNRKPPDFDWITTRRKCSLRQMFEELRVAIEKDVSIANGFLKTEAGFEFKMAGTTDRFRVYIQSPYVDTGGIAIAIVLSPKSIIVHDGATGTVKFEIGIGLNDDGDCRFIIEGKELDSWQVRRRALEDMLFVKVDLS